MLYVVWIHAGCVLGCGDWPLIATFGNGQRQHTMQRTTHSTTSGTWRRACRVQVGYGDQYPVTILGRVAIIVSLGFSVVLSAMLVNTIIKKCAPTPEYH